MGRNYRPRGPEVPNPTPPPGGGGMARPPRGGYPSGVVPRSEMPKIPESARSSRPPEVGWWASCDHCLVQFIVKAELGGPSELEDPFEATDSFLCCPYCERGLGNTWNQM